MNYTATARRSGRWWVVQCDQHPGAISQVARLDQAADVHREAIAFVADAPEAEIEVEVRPEIDPQVSEELAEAHRLAEQASEIDSRARTLRSDAARRLAQDGLSVRDVGSVMGVSYQRAHQLIER